ncbi:MAG: hypothetical protein K2O85_08555 [Helicobacter sp.]|nr:hypothetical protein [Helicobacter sp.]
MILAALDIGRDRIRFHEMSRFHVNEPIHFCRMDLCAVVRGMVAQYS